MKLGFVARADLPDRAKLARDLADRVRGEADLVAVPRLAQELGVPAREVGGMEGADADAVVAVGGDGPGRQALRRTSLPVCVVGAEGTGPAQPAVDPGEAVDRLVAGDYQVEERLRVDVSLPERDLPPAAAEVALESPTPTRVLSLAVDQDGDRVAELVADGLVVATPAGSLGASLAAGGPVTYPDVDALLVVPLQDLHLGSGPWVVPADRPLSLRLGEGDGPALLAVDGGADHEIAPGATVTLSRAPDPARVVTFDGGFPARARRRLG